jgi:hypothetical protein
LGLIAKGIKVYTEEDHLDVVRKRRFDSQMPEPKLMT